jgi:hypothetical protein
VNLYNYPTNPLGWIDPLGLCSCDPAAIADAAKARKGEGGWGAPGYRGGLGWITENKCNLFVNKVTEEGNSTQPEVNNRQATAGEIANPNQNIADWQVVTDGSLKDGDVIAQSMSGRGYTGHTGVVAFENGQPKTISASSLTGKIEHNYWGFRRYENTHRIESSPDFVGPLQPPFADKNITVRRCICP